LKCLGFTISGLALKSRSVYSSAVLLHSLTEVKAYALLTDNDYEQLFGIYFEKVMLKFANDFDI